MTDNFGHEPTTQDLWEVIQQQQTQMRQQEQRFSAQAQLQQQQLHALQEQLNRKRRWRPRLHLRLFPVALTLLLAGAMVVSPASAAGGKPDSAGAVPASSGGTCTPAQLTGDATNTCTGTTDFNAAPGNSQAGTWNFSDTTTNATTIRATCPNGGQCWGVEGDGTGRGVYGHGSGGGSGVYGDSSGTSSTGVRGTADIGVLGLGNGAIAPPAGTLAAVYGSGTNGSTTSPLGVIGVWGQSDFGEGMYGVSNIGPGVYGQSDSDWGVYGISSTGTGVEGSGPTAIAGISSVSNGTGVYGQVTSGYAVRGVGSSGNGVRGESTSGYGMVGTSVSAVGGYLRGKAIQLHLQPTAATPPTAAQRGDLMADTAGHLWFCTTTGTGSAAPATWVKIV